MGRWGKMHVNKISSENRSCLNHSPFLLAMHWIFFLQLIVGLSVFFCFRSKVVKNWSIISKIWGQRPTTTYGTCSPLLTFEPQKLVSRADLCDLGAPPCRQGVRHIQLGARLVLRGVHVHHALQRQRSRRPACPPAFPPHQKHPHFTVEGTYARTRFTLWTSQSLSSDKHLLLKFGSFLCKD